MNILFYAGEVAVTYAFPQLGAALTTVRYARTAYKVAKASAAVLSGDLVGGGVTLAGMAVTELAGTSIGPMIPGSSGINPAYLQCVTDCARENKNGYVWDLAACMAACEQYR